MNTPYISKGEIKQKKVKLKKKNVPYSRILVSDSKDFCH